MTSNLARQDMSVDDFENISFFGKFKILSKKLKHACQENKTFIVCFFACMVTRLYYVMFSTFWLLFLMSYKDDLYTADEAKQLYARVMIASVVFGTILVPLIGKGVDMYNPQKTIPLAFLFRAFAVVCFLFVQDPRHFYSYFCAIMLVIGTSAEQICTDAVIFRSADRELRGTIYGVATTFGFAGQFIFSLIGGFLVDKINAKAPFAFVGILDVGFAITVFILGTYYGYVKNDIAERKRKEYELKETLLRIQREKEEGKGAGP